MLKLTITASLVLMAFIVIGFSAMAFDPASTGLTVTGDEAGYDVEAETSQNLALAVGKVLSALYLVLGLVLLIVIIYGGVLYMTAGGSDEQVSKAKKYIINGIIGLVIILLAYVITTYVVDKIGEETGATGSTVIPTILE